MKINQSQIEKAQKYLLYKKNPIVFMEECCYLPETGGDKLVVLYEPQKAIVRDFYHGENHMILLKSRQCGFSTLWQMISVHLSVFYKNVIIGITSRDGAEASDFCRKTCDILDKLPKWLDPGYKWKNIQNYCTKNGTQLISSAISLANPGALFRGKSICLLIMDEIAHVQKADEAWTGVAASLSIAQMRAKTNKIPYGTILLSTPNRTTGIGKFFFEMWSGANEQKNNFRPYKIHWSEISELKNSPTWYKEQCKRYNNDPRKIAQELNLKFIGSGDTLFPEEVQTKLQSIQVKPKRTLRLAQGGELYIYEEPTPLRLYLIGIDTASSYGKDNSAVEVLDYLSMRQVMEYNGKTNPKSFADVIRFICKLVPNNLLIIETTGGYGLTILNELQYDENESYNIFQENKNNKTEQDRVPGLSTTTKTRPLVVQSLYEHVVSETEKIKSNRLIGELLALVDKAGKVQADEGANDDLCFALGFCCYVKKYYNENIILEEEIGENSEIKEIYQSIQKMNNLPILDKRDLSLNPEAFKRDMQKYIESQIKQNKIVDPIKLIWGENSIFG